MTIKDYTPLPLKQAIRIRDHFRFLVGKKYKRHQPELGEIAGLVILPFGTKEEVMEQYPQQELQKLNGIVLENITGEDRYEVLLMARIGHPQLSSGYILLKELREYISEQNLKFDMEGFL